MNKPIWRLLAAFLCLSLITADRGSQVLALRAGLEGTVEAELSAGMEEPSFAGNMLNLLHEKGESDFLFPGAKTVEIVAGKGVPFYLASTRFGNVHANRGQAHNRRGLFWIARGAGTLEFGTHSQEIRAGQLILISENTWYDIRPKDHPGSIDVLQIFPEQPFNSRLILTTLKDVGKNGAFSRVFGWGKPSDMIADFSGLLDGLDVVRYRNAQRAEPFVLAESAQPRVAIGLSGTARMIASDRGRPWSANVKQGDVVRIPLGLKSPIRITGDRATFFVIGPTESVNPKIITKTDVPAPATKSYGQLFAEAAPAPASSQAVSAHTVLQLRATLLAAQTTLDRLKVLMKFSGAETAGDFERIARLGKNTAGNFLRGGAFGTGTRRMIQSYVFQNYGIRVTLGLSVLKPDWEETQLNTLLSPDKRYDFLMRDILGWTYGELRKRSRSETLRADSNRSLPREQLFSQFKQARTATQRLTRHGLEQGLREEFRRSIWLDGQLRVVSRSVPDILHSLPDAESRFNWLLDEWLLVSRDELLEELGIPDTFSVSLGRFMTPTGNDSERRNNIRQTLEQKLQARAGTVILLDENLLPRTPPPAVKADVAVASPRENHLPNRSGPAIPTGMDLENIRQALDQQSHAGDRLRALRELAGYVSRQRFADETGVDSWTILRFEQNETSMRAAHRATIRSFLEARYATLGITLGLDKEFRITQESLTNRIASHKTAANRLAFILGDLLGWTYPELTRRARAASSDFLGKELTFSSNRSVEELLDQAGPSTRRLIRHVVETALQERHGRSPRFDREFMPVESAAAQLAQIQDFESRFEWLREHWLLWDKNELMEKAGINRLKYSMEQTLASTNPRNMKKKALIQALAGGLSERGDINLKLNKSLLPVSAAGMEEQVALSVPGNLKLTQVQEVLVEALGGKTLPVSMVPISFYLAEIINNTNRHDYRYDEGLHTDVTFRWDDRTLRVTLEDQTQQLFPLKNRLDESASSTSPSDDPEAFVRELFGQLDGDQAAASAAGNSVVGKLGIPLLRRAYREGAFSIEEETHTPGRGTRRVLVFNKPAPAAGAEEHATADWTPHWDAGFPVADGKDDLILREEPWQAFFRKIGRTTRNARVLDLASGNLALALLAQRTRFGFELHALDRADIKPSQIPDSDEIQFRRADFLQNGYPDEYFKAVTGRFGLEYINPDRGLPELSRILAPSGEGLFLLHHSESVKVAHARRVTVDVPVLPAALNAYEELRAYRQNLTGGALGQLWEAVAQLLTYRNHGDTEVQQEAEAAYENIRAILQMPNDEFGAWLEILNNHLNETRFTVSAHRDLVKAALSPEAVADWIRRLHEAGLVVDRFDPLLENDHPTAWVLELHKPPRVRAISLSAGLEETPEAVRRIVLGYFVGEVFWKRIVGTFREEEGEAALYAAGESILFEDENHRTFETTLKYPLVMRTALAEFPRGKEWVAYLPRELPGFQELLEQVAAQDARMEANRPHKTIEEAMDWELFSIMHDFLKEERGFGQHGAELAFKRPSTAAGVEESSEETFSVDHLGRMIASYIEFAMDAGEGAKEVVVQLTGPEGSREVTFVAREAIREGWPNQIAKELDELGIKRSKGKHWWIMTVGNFDKDTTDRRTLPVRLKPGTPPESAAGLKDKPAPLWTSTVMDRLYDGLMERGYRVEWKESGTKHDRYPLNVYLGTDLLGGFVFGESNWVLREVRIFLPGDTQLKIEYGLGEVRPDSFRLLTQAIKEILVPLGFARPEKPEPDIAIFSLRENPADTGLEEITRAVNALRQVPPAVPGSASDAVLVFTGAEKTGDLIPWAVQQGWTVALLNGGPRAAGVEELLRRLPGSKGHYAIGVSASGELLKNRPRQILIEDNPQGRRKGFQILGLRAEDLPPPVAAALGSVLAYLDTATEA